MKEVVTISKELYQQLIGFAEAELQNIESGIEEGIYEDDKSNQDRMLVLENIINTIPIHPEVYVFVQGGLIQGASANMSIDFNVFDKDNYDDSDFDHENEEWSLKDWNQMIKEGTKNGTLISIY